MIEIAEKPNRSRRLPMFFLVAFVMIALVAIVYFYRENVKLKQGVASAEQNTAESTIDLVGQLVVLPEGEEPTIATVTDPEILKSQVFFANAQMGDRVLIYTNARKAILYRPSLHKIVEIAPLTIGEQPEVGGGGI